MQKIEILGPGCARCKQTHSVVQHVVEQEGLHVDVVKEESLARLSALNVMATPAVAVDGEVVFSGRVPSAEEVRAMLRTLWDAVGHDAKLEPRRLEDELLDRAVVDRALDRGAIRFRESDWKPE